MGYVPTSAEIDEDEKRLNALEPTFPRTLTSAQFAKLAGVGLSTIRRWEARGITPPRTALYIKLYLEADVLAFLSRLAHDPEFRRAVGVYKTKSQTAKAKALAQVSEAVSAKSVGLANLPAAGAEPSLV